MSANCIWGVGAYGMHYLQGDEGKLNVVIVPIGTITTFAQIILTYMYAILLFNANSTNT